MNEDERRADEEDRRVERRASTKILASKVVELEARVLDLQNNHVSKADFMAMKDSVDNLVTAWNTAAGVVSFVKWLAALGASILVLWQFAKAVWLK